MNARTFGSVLFAIAVGILGVLMIGSQPTQPKSMSHTEQTAYFGGDDPAPAPVIDTVVVDGVTWYHRKLCQLPTTPEEKAASQCSLPNTSCSAGNSLCAERKRTGILCADEKIYKNTNACKSADTDQWCAIHATPEVICYELSLCICIQDLGDPRIYNCIRRDLPAENVTAKACGVASQPPQR